MSGIEDLKRNPAMAAALLGALGISGVSRSAPRRTAYATARSAMDDAHLSAAEAKRDRKAQKRLQTAAAEKERTL